MRMSGLHTLSSEIMLTYMHACKLCRFAMLTMASALLT